MAKLPKQDELLDFSFDVPKTGWMHTPTEFKEGMYCYGTKPKNLEVVGMPNGHDWSPADEDWHLPEGWKDIVLNGMEDLMKKYRSFKLYMDVCVRCGACADKCHFYQGTGDPKNMPVARAELLRSVYLHPRETERLPALESCVELDRKVALESYLVNSTTHNMTIVGIKSTSLQTAKKMGYKALSLIKAVDDDIEEIIKFYTKIGIECSVSK